MTHPERKTSDAEVTSLQPPVREGLQEAEEALRGFRMDKEYNDEGLLKFEV